MCRRDSHPRHGCERELVRWLALAWGLLRALGLRARQIDEREWLSLIFSNEKTSGRRKAASSRPTPRKPRSVHRRRPWPLLYRPARRTEPKLWSANCLSLFSRESMAEAFGLDNWPAHECRAHTYCETPRVCGRHLLRHGVSSRAARECRGCGANPAPADGRVAAPWAPCRRLARGRLQRDAQSQR